MKTVEITSIIKKMQGGSTEPILIDAIDDTGLVSPYVLKLYKISYERLSYPTLKEIIVAYLANEFDLRTPDVVLTSLSDDLIKVNNKRFSQFNIKNQKEYNLSTPKVAFQYMTAQTVGYNDEFNFNISEYSNIYAFDFLVFNNDRGGHNNKPNLLIDDSGFILIDHELTLNFIDNSNIVDSVLDLEIDLTQLEYPNPIILDNIKTSISNGTTKYNYIKHLFFNKLRSFENKQELFNDFTYYLEEFSTTRFKLFLETLIPFGLTIESLSLLLDYITFIQKNAKSFENTLINSLSNG